MKVIIQTKFEDEEYDIDDGVVLWKADLVGDDGKDMTSDEVKELVRDALKDRRFKKQPVVKHNCVRVFYADEDEEKHHVDFPVYRKESEDGGRELAGSDGGSSQIPLELTSGSKTR